MMQYSTMKYKSEKVHTSDVYQQSDQKRYFEHESMSVLFVGLMERERMMGLISWSTFSRSQKGK